MSPEEWTSDTELETTREGICWLISIVRMTYFLLVLGFASLR